VACGAISGFHAVVAGGTTSKQLRSEGAALRIGYGGMLLESLFAVLVMVALCGSLSAQDYMREVHPLGGKGNPSLAFAHGVGNLLFNAFALSPAWGCIAGIILIEGFAATTLDSAVRLQRYLLEELWAFLFRGSVPRPLTHYLVNSGIAVALMLVLAFSGGFKAVWAVFGTGNQLLAALTLLAVSVWLLYHGRRMWVALAPACVMCALTITALVLLLLKNFRAKDGVSQFNATLFVAELFLLCLAVGMIAFAVKFFVGHMRRARAGQ
jgi:carbon starvation protein